MMKIIISVVVFFSCNVGYAQDYNDTLLLLHNKENEFEKVVGRTTGVILSEKFDNSNLKLKNSYISELSLEYGSNKRKIKYLTAVDAKNNLLLIFDNNNDNDFENDSYYYYNTEELQKSPNLKNLPVVALKFNNTDDDSHLFIKPIPRFFFQNLIISTGDLFIDSTKFYFESVFNKESFFKIQNQQYKLTIINRFLSFSYSNRNSLFIVEATQGNKRGKFISISDTFFIEKSKIVIENLSYYGDSVSLKITSNQGMVGYSIGFISPDIEGIDIVKNNFFSSSKIESSYILLDFWGTWCAPCKELTPFLRSLADTYKEEIALISIAFDSDTAKVVRYIKKNNMKWVNLMQNDKYSNRRSYIQNYKIESYPTFILLNQKREIIFLETGKDGFNELQKFLKNLLH